MLAKLLRKPLLSIVTAAAVGSFASMPVRSGARGILSKRLDSTIRAVRIVSCLKVRSPGGACGQTWPRRMGTDCPAADIIARLRIGPADCALRLS
jgi:hypothetical protein